MLHFELLACRWKNKVVVMFIVSLHSVGDHTVRINILSSYLIGKLS